MGTVFAHRSPSLFLSPGPSGSQAPSFKERALHHVAGPFPSRVYDGRSITVNAPSHHDGGSLTSEAAATKSPRYNIVAQVAKWQGRSVFAFTRPGDVATQAFAQRLGASWAGGSDEAAPEPLDAAILFAPVGALVPLALKAVRKGGRVVCAGIHMSDIPSFPYRLLWEERQLVSVANLTRSDGIAFLRLAPKIHIVTKTTQYPLIQANQALADLRAGRFEGAAVLTAE
jgi:hypothetical protein